MWSRPCWQALGLGELELQGGEVLDNDRGLPPKPQYYTDKHHFYLQHFTNPPPPAKKQSCTPSPSSNLSWNPLLVSHPPTPRFFTAPLQVDQLMCNKLFQSLQVLSIELHVIVSSPLHPEGLHRALTAFIQRQTMREVDDLVLCTVNHQYWGRHLWNLVDALE